MAPTPVGPLGACEGPDARDIKIEYLSSCRIPCSFRAQMNKYPSCFHSLIPLQSLDKQTSSVAAFILKFTLLPSKMGLCQFARYFRQSRLVTKCVPRFPHTWLFRPALVLFLLFSIHQKPDFRWPGLLGRWVNPLLLLEAGGDHSKSQACARRDVINYTSPSKWKAPPNGWKARYATAEKCFVS